MNHALWKIIKYQLHDMIRSRWLILYTLLLFAVTDGLFRFGADAERVSLSLMNIILFIIPLIGLVFGTLFYYNSREFIELLLAQPIRRWVLYLGLYLGLNTSLIFALLVGMGIPPLYHVGGYSSTFMILLLVGVLLSVTSTALAFLIAVRSDQRVKGIGFAIVLWLALAIIYDGAMLIMIILLKDYPLDRLVLIMSMLNPIDLGRILLLIQFDISALMGYTGAIFQRFFGGTLGLVVSISSLMLWFLLPYWLGHRAFRQKDF